MKEIKLQLNKNELYNEFNESELNPSLGKYVFKKCNIRDLKDEITINIYLEKDLKSVDTSTIINIFREYFEDQLKEKLDHQNKENIIFGLLFLIGLTFLIIYYYLYKLSIPIISEVFLIIGWVTIWEVVYRFLFTRNLENYEIKKYQKLLKSDIKFF